MMHKKYIKIIKNTQKINKKNKTKQKIIKIC